MFMDRLKLQSDVVDTAKGKCVTFHLQPIRNIIIIGCITHQLFWSKLYLNDLQ